MVLRLTRSNPELGLCDKGGLNVSYVLPPQTPIQSLGSDLNKKVPSRRPIQGNEEVSEKRSLAMEQRICNIPLAPASDQLMTPCFMRPPMTFLQALSMETLPIDSRRARKTS